ncbi:MAG: OmpH family outer membrane protein [Bacteroidaceae bacterium]|nr:OmpH family outer membrane protein [Bacteroidaceae bacterium]
MTKHIAFITALLFAAMVSAQEAVLSDSALNSVERVIIQPQRFGYLSYTEVLRAMPEYETAIKSLDELKQTYDQELLRAEQDFSRKFYEFVDGQQDFPENIMLKRQKELQQLMNESISFKEEAKKLLTQSEQELMAPLHDRLKDVLRKVGLERNYSFILNTDNNSYPFINTTGEGEDCTDIVKENLQK